jgi:hypothetical protein
MINSQWKEEIALLKSCTSGAPIVLPEEDLPGICRRSLLSRLIKNAPAFVPQGGTTRRQADAS